MNAPVSIPLERYYRLHSHIYDATRWSFLFGRKALVREVSSHVRPGRILEIGCGTGKNLVSLASRFPDAEIAGLDLSKDMLERASRKFSGRPGRPALIRRDYSQPLHSLPLYDLIVFSYTLSMINPGFQQALINSRRDLAPGGMIAVVDFDDSPSDLFKSWMRINHVRMDGHLLPMLNELFEPACQTMMKAYGGLWRYFMFIGRAKYEKTFHFRKTTSINSSRVNINWNERFLPGKWQSVSEAVEDLEKNHDRPSGRNRDFLSWMDIG